MRSPVECPYCGEAAELVDGDYIYPHRHDLHDKKFHHCAPCDAYVGCHAAGAWLYQDGKKIVSDGTIPLGRLANAELRDAKQKAHAAFDPFWKGGYLRRRDAYKKLADALGIHASDCHIGMFDVAMCQRVVTACRQWRSEMTARAA